MTERNWQQIKFWRDSNSKNINPIIQMAYNDNVSIIPNKSFNELNTLCKQGSFEIKMWEISDNLSLDDMALLACKDAECDLNLCQSRMTDPYEKQMKNCNMLFSSLNKCLDNEIAKYKSLEKPMVMKTYLKGVLEERKKLRTIKMNGGLPEQLFPVYNKATLNPVPKKEIVLEKIIL